MAKRKTTKRKAPLKSARKRGAKTGKVASTRVESNQGEQSAPSPDPALEAALDTNLFPKISHIKKRAFLAAYSHVGMIGRSAEAAGISPRTHQNWVKDDHDYAEAFKDAAVLAGEVLEEEARRRAVEGVRRLKFGKNGKPLIDPETKRPYTEHEYSDTLLIFLMKGANPAKYRERVDVTSNDQPVYATVTISAEQAAGLV